jgi:hypothetical protein
MVLPADQLVFIGVLISSFIISCSLSRETFNSFYPARLQTAIFIHALQVVWCITGGLLLFGLPDVALFTTLVMANYTWVKFGPIKALIRQGFVWITMFSFLFFLHYTRPFMAVIHISGCTMLLTVKYTMYIAEEDVTKPRPSLMDWLGWTFFIPSFFTGPTLALNEYLNWVNYVTAIVPPHLDLKVYDFDQLQPPRTSVKALTSAIWFAPFAILGTSMFPVASVAMFDMEVGVLHRILYTWIALWCIRCRYYLLWGIAEASYIGSDAARHVWHFGRNVEVWNIELATTVHDITNNWNRSTAMWLKRNVYQPTLAKLTETMHDHTRAARVAILVTNVISAMWHGFSAGYYMTFLGTGACTVVSRLLHQHVDPIVNSSQSRFVQISYQIATVIWVNLLLITFALPFQLHSFQQSWAAWRGLYFVGHMWAGLALIVVLLVITQKQEKKIREVAGAAPVVVEEDKKDQ